MYQEVSVAQSQLWSWGCLTWLGQMSSDRPATSLVRVVDVKRKKVGKAQDCIKNWYGGEIHQVNPRKWKGKAR